MREMRKYEKQSDDSDRFDTDEEEKALIRKKLNMAATDEDSMSDGRTDDDDDDGLPPGRYKRSQSSRAAAGVFDYDSDQSEDTVGVGDVDSGSGDDLTFSSQNSGRRRSLSNLNLRYECFFFKKIMLIVCDAC